MHRRSYSIPFLSFFPGTILFGLALLLGAGFCSSAPVGGKQSGENAAEAKSEKKSRSANVEGKAQCIEGNCNDGEGTYVWEDGSRYAGNWQHGKFNGNGVYYWSSGDRYQGQFVDGDCEGMGIYIWANGARYEGEWKGGKIHGRGTYTWPNGARIENAEFENHHLKQAKDTNSQGE